MKTKIDNQESENFVRKIKGVVRGTKSRYGFLISKDYKDIFISPQEMDKVFSGDLVEVKIFNYNKKNQSLIINKVIKTEKKTLIGEFSEDNTGCYVFPDDFGFNRKIRIPKSLKNGARNNQFVKVEIIEHPFLSKKPKAKIIEVIGDKNCWNLHANYNLSKYNISSYVSKEISLLSSDINTNITNDKSKKRKDLSKLNFFTIDGENTQDIDDAIYVQKIKNGKKWKLLVAISDVSEFLKEGSDVDNDAYNRTSTVYMLGKTIPMLANEFTDNVSLKPLEKRFVVVADMLIDESGNVEKYSFYEALIESKSKLSYNEVNDYIEIGIINENITDHTVQIDLLNELHKVLNKNRKEKNICHGKRKDIRAYLDHFKKIENINMVEASVSNRMVEESMLCANKCASHFLFKNKIKSPIFKCQLGIKEHKINDLYNFLSNYIPLTKDMLETANGFKTLYSLIEEHEESDMLKYSVVQNLEESFFSEKHMPHFFMGFDDYTYFTSPIRRYSDIIVHRCIKAKINGKKYISKRVNVSKHLNIKTRKIQSCVFDSEKWLHLDFLKNKNISGSILDAKITKITSFNIHVFIEKYGIYGVIPLKNILDNRSFKRTGFHKIEAEKISFSFYQNIKVSFEDISENNSFIFRIF